MSDEAGRLVVPPPAVKEALHHLPKDYTAGHDDRVRHRLVGNGWHWRVPPPLHPRRGGVARSDRGEEPTSGAAFVVDAAVAPGPP